MPKPFMENNNSDTIKPIAGEIRGFLFFPKVLVQKLT